ncbi:MAG: AAA family ATPase [Sandaracinaceae bacterium]
MVEIVTNEERRVIGTSPKGPSLSNGGWVVDAVSGRLFKVFPRGRAPARVSGVGAARAAVSKTWPSMRRPVSRAQGDRMSVSHTSLSGLMIHAQRSARRRQQQPSTAHALLVMLQQDRETATLLARSGVREMDLIRAIPRAGDEPDSAMELAAERAAQLAGGLGQSPRPVHLLAAIAREGRCAGYRCLEHAGCDPSRLHEQVRGVLSGRAIEPAGRKRSSAARTVPPVPRAKAKNPPLRTLPPEPPQSRAPTQASTGTSDRRPSASRRPSRAPSPPEQGAFDLDPVLFPLLSRIGRNLTAAAEEGRIDPVIGRDHEIDRLLDVLARRRANNPVLVGLPGVGKTAIVEGLALRLVTNKEACGRLADRILIEVSAGALVSGTGVRGALADKLKTLRDEVARADAKILLFLDEIHAIAGGDGPDDLANELKASLARGELPCIGATTDAEYRRVFERDAALVRRFSRIDVAEPTPSDALEILRGLVPRYELHHAVAYDPPALKAAVELSVRYCPEGVLPDKAISVLDLAAARVRRHGGSVVDVASVARVVAEQASIPADRLLMRDADRLLRLDAHLRERVIGQREALARVADALRKGAAGFRGARPLATFLLLGPTGVGKTETAKAIADLLFPSSGITRFDMSEFSEPHAVARLLGAPPGYVGHEDGGQLTEAVRRRPYQLILLDEVEKAHPEVLLALLPLLDEGRLTDGRGRTVDFTNTVVVMTSNLGAQAALPPKRIGFGSGPEQPVGERERAIASARRALPPELFNRIDEPLCYLPLGRDDVRAIARRLLDEVAQVLVREHQVGLEVEPSAIDALIASGGFDAELGARPMRRAVGRSIEAPLASLVLSGAVSRGMSVIARGEDGTVLLEPRGSVEAAE